MSCWRRLLRAFQRCEFAEDCPLYRENSYTCNEGDLKYCGEYKKYKNRKYGKVESLR